MYFCLFHLSFHCHNSISDKPSRDQAKITKLPFNHRFNLRSNKIFVFFFPEHKNVKAFITHGGLMGTQEAIQYGVPLIGIPLFADQFININTYVRLNIAVGLETDTLTEEKMDHALNSILNDPKYRYFSSF